jgi:hypothetical protein
MWVRTQRWLLRVLVATTVLSGSTVSFDHASWSGDGVAGEQAHAGAVHNLQTHDEAPNDDGNQPPDEACQLCAHFVGPLRSEVTAELDSAPARLQSALVGLHPRIADPPPVRPG